MQMPDPVPAGQDTYYDQFDQQSAPPPQAGAPAQAPAPVAAGPKPIADDDYFESRYGTPPAPAAPPAPPPKPREKTVGDRAMTMA